MPRRTQQIANPFSLSPHSLAHLRPLRLNDFGRCVRCLCSTAVLPFIVIAFCCSSVSLELFPFLIHFACLWHVRSTPGPGTKCRIRNVFIVYTTLQFIANLCRNQSKQAEAARPFATDSLPSLHALTLPLSLFLSLSVACCAASVNANPIDIATRRVSAFSISDCLKGIQS